MGWLTSTKEERQAKFEEREAARKAKYEAGKEARAAKAEAFVDKRDGISESAAWFEQEARPIIEQARADQNRDDLFGFALGGTTGATALSVMAGGAMASQTGIPAVLKVSLTEVAVIEVSAARPHDRVSVVSIQPGTTVEVKAKLTSTKVIVGGREFKFALAKDANRFKAVVEGIAG